MLSSSPKTIDAYITLSPKKAQPLLKQLRDLIRKQVPNAEEKIGYGIPTFTLYGNLIHFGGFAEHIGLYPGPAGVVAFSKELSKYKTSKGAIQFPINKPLPVSLIKKIIAFCVKRNLSRLKKPLTKKIKSSKV